MRLIVLLPFMLSVAGLPCVGEPASSKSHAPRATAGTLDLRGWDFADGGLALDGVWLWSGGVFLPPDREGESPMEIPQSARFPVAGTTGKTTPYGAGTLSLEILLPLRAPRLALRVPLIWTAYELYANGEKIGGMGRPSLDPASALPAYRPALLLLPPAPDGRILLSLRFSNYHDLFAGVGYSIRIGDLASMMTEREHAALLESLMFGAIALIGLYHFGFFAFRPKNRPVLWFSIFCVLIALRGTLYSELIFLDWVPGASWFFIIRSVYLCTFLPPPLFILFIADLYPERSVRGVALAMSAAFGAYGLAIVFAPVAFFTSLLLPFQALIVAVGIYATIVIVRALAAREDGAAIFVVGTGIFLLTIVLDIIKTSLFWTIPSMVPVGMIVFIIAQAFVLAMQFSKSFATSERYAETLARINVSLERFIPREFLGFLKKENIVEIELGDWAECRMSIFFLDIRNFTSLSENMSPRDNFRFINSFLGTFGPIIRARDGFVDKYIGDGIMALFPGNPDDALHASIDMRERLVDYNNGRARGGYDPIRFGIGIHEGPLMLGTIGENKRMDSTVISDAVNAASRLEGLTKKYSADILVSGEILRSLAKPNDFESRFLAEELVKGKTKAVQVFELIGRSPPSSSPLG